MLLCFKCTLTSTFPVRYKCFEEPQLGASLMAGLRAWRGGWDRPRPSPPPPRPASTQGRRYIASGSPPSFTASLRALTRGLCGWQRAPQRRNGWTSSEEVPFLCCPPVALAPGTGHPHPSGPGCFRTQWFCGTRRLLWKIQILSQFPDPYWAIRWASPTVLPPIWCLLFTTTHLSAKESVKG